MADQEQREPSEQRTGSGGADDLAGLVIPPEFQNGKAFNVSLWYADLATGNGELAASGQEYAVHYTGWLRNGTKFDSSLDRGRPIKFVQGRRQVIAGWDAGFKGMRVGGKRRLLIPYDLAYGEKGAGPIPPKADLIFDVELVAATTVPDALPGADVLLPFVRLHAKVLELADAVPEDQYEWSPATEAPSFASLFLRIADGARLLLDAASSGDNDVPNSGAQAKRVTTAGELTKDRILGLLDTTLKDVRKSVTTARLGELMRDTSLLGRPTTQRGVFICINTHIAEHLGQALTYARLRGIAVTWSDELNY